MSAQEIIKIRNILENIENRPQSIDNSVNNMKIYEFKQRDIVTAKNQLQSSIYVSEADAQPNMSRRGFLGGLGKAAATGAAIGMGLTGANAQAQDSIYMKVRNNILRSQASLGGYLDYFEEKKIIGGREAAFARHAANNKDLKPFSKEWNGGIDKAQEDFKISKEDDYGSSSEYTKKMQATLKLIYQKRISRYCELYSAAEAFLSKPMLLNDILQWALKNRGMQEYDNMLYNTQNFTSDDGKFYIEYIWNLIYQYEQRNKQAELDRSTQSTRRR